MSKSHSVILKYLLTAMIACALCYLFPYTGDDWAWGSAIGLKRLASWFEGYNGRYISNLIVLALTRSRILRAIVMSITFTGIIYCVERITQRSWAFTMGLLGFLLLPRLIFRQTVSWTSGFANYSTSALLTLIYFVYLNEHQPEESCTCSFVTGLFLAILGICNTLIIEFLTVYHVVMSVSLFFISFKINKKIRTDYLIYMICCISGAAYMFSNSVFHEITVNPNGYFHVAEKGMIYQGLKNYFGMIYHQGFFNNWFINITLYSVCFLLFSQFKKTHPEYTKMRVLNTCMIIMSVFLIWSLITLILCGYSYIDYDHLPKVGLEGGITFINLIATSVITLFTTYKDGLNKKIAFLWISFILMIAPLFEVSPIGCRCFFTSYFVLILIICEAVKCISDIPAIYMEKFRKYYTVLSLMLVTGSTALYFGIYGTIYHAEQQRVQNIHNAIAFDSESVELSTLPYDDWLWGAALIEDNSSLEYRCRLFYGIPDDMDLIIVDQNDISVH